MRLRAELRQQWRAWLALALLLGVIGGIALTAAAGARRTDTAYPRFLRDSHAADLLVSPALSGFRGYFRAVARLPGVSSLDATMFPQMSLPGPGASPFSGMVAEGSPFGGEGTAVEPGQGPRGPHLQPGRPARGDDQPGAGGPGTGGPRRHAAPDRLPAAGRQPRHRARGAAGVPGVGDRGVRRRGDRAGQQRARRAAGAAEPGIRADTAGAVVQSRRRRRLRGAPAGASAAAFSREATALARRYRVGNVQVVHLATEYGATQRAIRPEAAALAIFAGLAGLIALAIIAQLLRAASSSSTRRSSRSCAPSAWAGPGLRCCPWPGWPW